MDAAKSVGLVTAAVGLGAAGVAGPEVPWWGELLMVLVSAALAFFGGRVGAR